MEKEERENKRRRKRKINRNQNKFSNIKKIQNSKYNKPKNPTNHSLFSVHQHHKVAGMGLWTLGLLRLPGNCEPDPTLVSTFKMEGARTFS